VNVNDVVAQIQDPRVRDACGLAVREVGDVVVSDRDLAVLAYVVMADQGKITTSPLLELAIQCRVWGANLKL
jgi:hypothetical protein